MNSPLLFVQYNTQELDQRKIEDPTKEQLKAIRAVLDGIESFYQKKIDILSLQEVSLFKKENIAHIQSELQLGGYHHFFHPAKTGVNALKKQDGSYHTDPQDVAAREASDPVNFGIFPHQYSSGIFYQKGPNQLTLLKTEVIDDVKWKEFNPSINLDQFRDHRGDYLNDDIPLFDKGLIIYTFQYHEKLFQLIQVHTTPAFHFHQEKTMNYQRNFDQLRFLEWILTGETDLIPQLKDKIATPNLKLPLVACGDWNVDFRQVDDKRKKGAKVIKRILERFQTFKDDPHLYSLVGKNQDKLLIDYIICSKEEMLQDIQIINPSHKNLGVELTSHLKCASDHFPLLLLFSP